MLAAPSLLHSGLSTGCPSTRSGRITTLPLIAGTPLASPSVTGNGRPLYRLPTAFKLQPPTTWFRRPRRFNNFLPWPNGSSEFIVRLKRWRESNSDTDRFILRLPGAWILANPQLNWFWPSFAESEPVSMDLEYV